MCLCSSHPCSLHRTELEQLLVRAAQATTGAEEGRAREWEEIKVRVWHTLSHEELCVQYMETLETYHQ